MSAARPDRAAIRRLRRGVVPPTHIRFLSVGGEAMVGEVMRLLRQLRAGTADAGFIHGEWGFGKTHVLGLIRHIALDEGCAVAYLNLNGRSAALNHPQRFYHLVAGRIRLGNVPPGLSSLIEACARDPARRDRLERWAGGNRHRGEFAAAISRLLWTWTDLRDAPSYAWSVLLGTDLAWADYAYKREKALQRLADLGACLAAGGAGGLVLQLDELETMDQLWNVRSRIGAYRVLGRLVATRFVLPFFAVTDRFHRLVEWDLKFRNLLDDPLLPADARTFLVGWQCRDFPTLSPPALTGGLAHALVEKIAELYRVTYGRGVPPVDREAVIREWMRSPVRSPRTLIRRTIHELDILRDGHP